jgi:hypothetical protein
MRIASYGTTIIHHHLVVQYVAGMIPYITLHTMATAGSKRPHEDSQADSLPSKPKLSRCANMKGTVTIHEILEDVLDKNPKHFAAISMFLDNCSCYDCKSHGHKDEDYTRMHDAENFVGGMCTFFTYVCPRELCTPDQAEMLRYASAMRAIVMHCIKKGYLDKEDPEVKDCLEGIAVARKLQGSKIIDEFKALSYAKWWDSLQQKDQGNAEEEEGASTWGDRYESSRDLEMPVEVKEVRNDGWLLQPDKYEDRSEGSDNAPVFVRLPPEVAKLGMKGMQMSCMSLGYRNGEWQPFNAYGEKACGPLANVYPPTP